MDRDMISQELGWSVGLSQLHHAMHIGTRKDGIYSVQSIFANQMLAAMLYGIVSWHARSIWYRSGNTAPTQHINRCLVP